MYHQSVAALQQDNEHLERPVAFVADVVRYEPRQPVCGTGLQHLVRQRTVERRRAFGHDAKLGLDPLMPSGARPGRQRQVVLPAAPGEGGLFADVEDAWTLPGPLRELWESGPADAG